MRRGAGAAARCHVDAGRTGPGGDGLVVGGGMALAAARRERVEAALGALLDQARTWTAAQPAAALREVGIRLSTRQTRKNLSRMDARRRTVQPLRHKHDPQKVDRTTAVLG